MIKADSFKSSFVWDMTSMLKVELMRGEAGKSVKMFLLWFI
jgi:hypothetical protein